MARKSTIEFSKGIEQILKELEACYTLKNIVMAGIVLLSKLPAADREKAIAQANTVENKHSPKKSLQNAIKVIKENAEIEKKQPGTIVQILGKREQAEFEQLCKLLGPDPEKLQKNTKKA